jgi:predicted RNA-binding Zn ribbon-like protein
MNENEEAAPGRLERVREFVNTIHIDPHLETPEESLGSPRELDKWLRAHELLGDGETAGSGDLARAIGLREALRSLLASNHGEPLGPDAVVVLRRASERAGLGLRFHDDGGSAVEPAATGVDGALGMLLADVNAAMADGSWSRLKVCLADDCRWAFYDRSRNHSRRWCTMRACGNRAKVRSYRERHAHGSA